MRFKVARFGPSQPDASVLKLRVCAYPNLTRQRGIAFLLFDSISKNPSLTLRVMIIPGGFVPLIPGSLEPFRPISKISQTIPAGINGTYFKTVPGSRESSTNYFSRYRFAIVIPLSIAPTIPRKP